MAPSLLLLAVFAFGTFQQAQGTGYLQVGFFLYEFRHDPTILSADITGQPVPPSPSSSSPDLTSEPPFNDTITDVTPWHVRTLLPKQNSGGVKIDSGAGRRANARGDDSLWSPSSPCNETSSPRPQYQFLLCLDYVNSQSDGTPCRLGKVKLSTLSHLGALGRDLVTFPSTLGMTPNGSVTSNPIIFGFEHWRGPVRLKVYVRCCGVAADHRAQCEESLNYTIHHRPASFSLSLSPQNVMLSGRGRLVLSLMLQCDRHYYGAACDVYCRVGFPSIQHAFCNVTSGKKQCTSGWKGPKCQVDIDECRTNYCQNGAHCVNSPPGSFTCQCPLGFVGRLCQRRQPVCHTIPCKNGGSCHDTQFGFVCFCPFGFAGNRCERQFHLLRENGSSSSEDGTYDVGETTDSDDRYFAMEWESWYSAVVVGVCCFITLLVVICCLLRGRLFRCGITANGSFYSLFTSTKTHDDSDLQPNQRSDSIMGDGSMSAMHTYQNVLSVAKRQQAQNPLAADIPAHEEMFLKPGTSDDLYLTHLPSCQHSHPDLCHYVNVGTASTSEEFEDLPNLVDPKRSPLMVHRELWHHTDVAERQRSSPNRHRSPLPIRRPLSEEAGVPRLTVTQHFQPCTGAASTGSSRPQAYDSPGRQREEWKSKASVSRKFVMRSYARDVYTIGGSLSAEDVNHTGSPKAAPRKSLLGAIAGRKKGSQPKLCSIRRMDSGGYEIPLKYQHASTIKNQYASLRRSRMEEHVYNELGLPDRVTRRAERRESGDNHLQQPGPTDRPARPAPLLTVDRRTSVFSETAYYADLTEHVAESPLNVDDSDLATVEEVRMESHVGEAGQGSGERPSAGIKRKIGASKACTRNARRYKRRTPSQRPLTQDCELDDEQPATSDDLEGRQAEAPPPTLALNEADDDVSDYVKYEELFEHTDTDEDMLSDCDYTDVFTRSNAAV